LPGAQDETTADVAPDALRQNTDGYYACRKGDLPPENYGFELI